MLTSLLIANRGEIACRVIRTARRLGIRTVAVYSDADANALHVRQADDAVHIGPSPARESYLVGERIIAAAKQTGAEAIHPGYGFLSENADFAQAVIDAGLIWVGPKPASIRAMGLKDAAKKLMMAAGVPTTPGYLGDDQSPERLQAEADAIGYPVLIKAVAGGGGKGMRRVETAAEFPDALVSCKREAASSFGDDRVLLEKYILSPRHIEVQVFGDAHGNVVHLFERDCSLQRRHQKVIEEAPAPGMDEATREQVCAAAVRAAKAVDYEGAGTIEFIADASEGLRADRIWFMEMNTRLQVEHPVTEEITGQDLVEWQLRVASGEPLPKRQEELSIDGWAMEARLYAEDVTAGFLPSTGPLKHFAISGRPRSDPVRSRIETGVQQGDAISPFYDPMIAKLIVQAATRQDAIAGLRTMCERVTCWPVKCNAAFLANLLDDPDFAVGSVDTGLIGRELANLVPETTPSQLALQSVALVSVDRALGGSPDNLRDTYIERPNSPWSWLRGFRANRDAAPTEVLLSDGKTDHRFAFEEIDVGSALYVTVEDEGYLVTDRGSTFVLTEARHDGNTTGGAAADGAILSPMPGRVIAVEVAAGDRVAKGQKLVTLEAMKMEHSLVAPFDGTVAELTAEAGGQVSEGKLLVRVERDEPCPRKGGDPVPAPAFAGAHRRGTAMAGRYYNDWTVGDQLAHDIRRTVTETDNLLFSTMTHNPQPLHLDAEAAKASEFGQILVNGTFTFSLMVGLSVSDTTLGVLVANLGYDKLVMPKPVFIGDTMRASSEVIELRDSRSRPTAGLVTFRHQLYNQRDELVCECLRTALIQRRPPATGSA